MSWFKRRIRAFVIFRTHCISSESPSHSLRRCYIERQGRLLPEDVIALIERYPDFRKMYEQTYEICQNIEQVMGMFSKELYELDRNTVRYMIDMLQEENARQKEENF